MRFARPGRSLDLTPPSQSPDREECVVDVETPNRQTTDVQRLRKAGVSEVEDPCQTDGRTENLKESKEPPDLTMNMKPNGECRMKPIPIESLTRLVEEILLKCGVSREDARVTADVLVTTDSWGVFTHGTKLLPGYVRRLLVDGLKPKGKPFVEREGPGWALVNGDRSLGMVTGVFSMNMAMEKARINGISLVTARNSCHFGAAGYYAYWATSHGMIGLAMSNDRPSVAAPGSRGPVLGSNPFAFGAPAGEGSPVVLDIATAVVAGGKIIQSLAEGKAIPPGWLIDEEGMPTTDGTLFPYHAFLMPMAGHKGYGIALMIEILSALLSGSKVRDKVGSWMHGDLSIPTDHGHAFFAIDPSLFAGAGVFETRMKDLAAGIKACPPARGVEAILLPGEIERKKRCEAEKQGIPLPEDLRNGLKAAAAAVSMTVEDFDL